MGLMTGALSKVVGTHLLTDIQTFVAALDTTFGGFRKRADATYKLLQARGTSFLVVAAPEKDALREAAYFVDRLGTERMPLAGLVLNRVHATRAGRLSAERSVAAAEALTEQAEQAEQLAQAEEAEQVEEAELLDGELASRPADLRLVAGLLTLHAERLRVIDREERMRTRFTSIHPEVRVAEVPALPGDVHDLDGLRVIGESLGAG